MCSFFKASILASIILLSSISIASTTTNPTSHEWTSLYHGKEAIFQEALTQKIKDICESYGIPYHITEENLILVPSHSRSSILSLISNHYKK